MIFPKIISLIFFAQGIDLLLVGAEDDESYKLEKDRTRRVLWLDRKRELILPPDTSLSITPMLAFPLFKQSSTWVAFENLQIQWTFFILFQGLGWTSDDNAWPIDISFLLPNVSAMNDPGSSRRHIEPCRFYHKIKFLNSTCNRNIPIMAFPAHSPGGERASLFPRLEGFLNSFGIRGRACLQRAVCEVHEVPLKNGFGLLGELLTLFFSISESIYARSHLPSYLKAEEDGKFGDCSNYHRKCPHSMFTSKTSRK